MNLTIEDYEIMIQGLFSLLPQSKNRSELINLVAKVNFKISELKSIKKTGRGSADFECGVSD